MHNVCEYRSLSFLEACSTIKNNKIDMHSLKPTKNNTSTTHIHALKTQYETFNSNQYIYIYIPKT